MFFRLFKNIKLLTGILFCASLGANVFNVNEYSSQVFKTGEEIKIDGRIDEYAWKNASVIDNFWQHYPIDTVRAAARTEVRLLYDDSHIYVAATCYEDNYSTIIQTLRRDDERKYWVSDAFSIVLDPMNNDINGYFFGLNSVGVKVDGTVSQNGVIPSFDVNWDKMWVAEVTHTDEGTFYEMAIPFSSIKYNPENKYWGANFIRNDMKRNVYDLWTKFSANYTGLDFGHNGIIEFTGELPQKNGGKVELMPSISGDMIRDIEDDKQPGYNLNTGVDAKIAIGTDLNLDLSVYPDFSTVAVDQQFIDFYRYEWYMPEQRSFFLENSDLFSSFGTYDDFLTPAYAYKIKPLYTRRIAIYDWEHVPMIYGARLSGNVSEDMRIGLLNVQTENYDDYSAQNTSAVSIQYAVFGRSAVKGLFTNRQATNKMEFNGSDYNRNAGLEFDFLSKNGNWSIQGDYHRSINPENHSNNNFYGGGMAYSSKNWKVQNWINHVDEDYIVDLGYVPRLTHKDDLHDTSIRIGFTEFVNWTEYLNYPSAERISVQSFHTRTATYFHSDGKLNEIQHEGGYFAEFHNKSSIYAGYYYESLDLVYPFDVLDNDKPIPASKYDNLSAILMYKSNPKKTLSGSLYSQYGSFYKGNKLFSELRMNYRIQPWSSFQLSYSLCDLDFPKEYGSDTYHLLGGRTEIYFSKDLIWTTLVQYNTQKDNTNINSLLQWRFRPLSDFFIVVKDDMTANGLDQKKFQIIFKLTCWFKM